MYMFGGRDESFFNDLWQFDFATKSWEFLTGQLPQQQPQHSNTNQPTNVGTSTINPHNNNANTSSHPSQQSPTTVLDGPLDSPHQQSLLPAPSARAGHTAVILPTRQSMLVFGGSCSAETCTNEVWEYAILQKRWIPLHPRTAVLRASSSSSSSEPIDTITAATSSSSPSSTNNNNTLLLQPPGRKGHTAVAVNESQMIVFGGVGEGCADNRVWIFDSEHFEWSNPTTAGTAPSCRMYHVAELDPEHHKLLVFGGRSVTSAPTFFNDLHQLDLATMTWSAIEAHGAPPSHRMCAASFLRNGVLCVFLGGSLAYLKDNFEFDVNSSTWRSVVAGPTGRTRPTAVIHNNTITLFGGCGHSQFLNDVVELELEPPSLRDCCRSWLRKHGCFEKEEGCRDAASDVEGSNNHQMLPQTLGSYINADDTDAV
jgi:hypothetical protein